MHQNLCRLYSSVPSLRTAARVGSCLAVALLLSLTSACAPNQDPDVLTLGGPFEFTSQDPARDGFVYTRMQVAESLLEVDARGQLQPGLATDWQVSDDGLRWTFELREDVDFHDGAHMDAEAVVHALRMALRKPGAINTAPIDDFSVDGPYRVSVHLSEPFRPLGAIMAHFTSVILSPDSYTDEAAVPWMYGTGPYQVASFDPPHRIEVSRFDDYWGENANIGRAIYLTGHRAESRALQVMAGQTDIIYTLDPASLDLLQRQDDVHVHSDTIPRTIQIKLNSGHPFMAERDARRAMSLAVDRTGIAERVIRVPGTEANQLVPASLTDWHVDELPPLDHDIDHARSLLTDLGWEPGPDGVLRRDGERFELRMTTYADRPELIVVATAIQAQWRTIGIDLEVTVVNSSGIPREHHEGTLETALVARNYGNVADPLGVFLADYGNGGNGEWGAMGWESDEVPRWLRQMVATTDDDEYRELAERTARLLVEEMPVIPVVFYTQQTALSDRVENFSFDPYERNYRISEMSFPEQ
ncbi:ABC transporter substrate-binding protein [Aquisalimonas asiatica]|uniref:Peptide/nickel transport system substrate-binding protein n=1 Tax=Aquisalimonas asiatica TaxID=406100 RepID=A0A1H8S3V6_9GAMM|nr:ABC transporter substrate-binding protein [Aquisalimonas asiatica]SEO73381.1 peptide/nickel transport system substrate-binding protein [Aquisalimonas asiatica]